MGVENINEKNSIKQEKRKKRKKKISVIFTKVFLLLLTVFLAISTFSIVSYCWKDSGLQSKVISNYRNKEDIIYYKDGTNREIIKKMKTFVNSLPETMKKTLNEDWVIVVDTEMPKMLSSNKALQYQEYDTSGLVVGGYTFPQCRTIYVNSSWKEEVIYSCFVHEIGHFISFELGSIHGSKEWCEIYSEGCNVLDIDDYGRSNEAEFFATCFELYTNSPEQLSVYLPETITYFNNVMKQPIRHENYLQRFGVGCTNAVNTIRSYIKAFQRKESK